MPHSARTLLSFLAALLLAGCVPPSATREEAPVPAPKKAEPACAGKPLRKVLVTAFPLRYPEQIKSGEYMGWAQTTGEELARRLAAGRWLRVASATQRFPFDSPELAPTLERGADHRPLAIGWAAQEKAQYVVAGVFRDFGTARKWAVVPERQIVVEAYLYDGADGRLLARQEFSRQLLADGALPKNVAPGTRAFAESRLGAAYNGLVDDIAIWIEESAACLPFPVRVTRVEGRRLHLDAGRDSGIAPGAELAVAPDMPIKPAAPGMLRTPLAVVKEVLPGTAIAEVPPQRTPPSFKAGDLLYVADRNKP
jgi:hypothetical protein